VFHDTLVAFAERRIIIMDMFEKATKVAKEMGDTVINSAKSIGGNLYNTTKEQSEMASLNVQKSLIEKRMTEYYAEIGKRYVEYMENCEGGEVFQVNDILEKMQPDLKKLSEVKEQIAEKEFAIKEGNEQKARRRAQETFDKEKETLDKALNMEILSEEEYEEKLALAKNKLEHYDLLRKVDMQLSMGIITKSEYDEKVKNILN